MPPEPSTAAAFGLTEPAAEDFQRLLDLRDQFEQFLELAADEWFRQWAARDASRTSLQSGWIETYNSTSITYQYLAIDSDGGYNGRDLLLAIPPGDLLPTRANHREEPMTDTDAPSVGPATTTAIPDVISIPEPTETEFAQLLDLRTKIDRYLRAAAAEWFERWRAEDPQRADAQSGKMLRYDAEALVFEYAEDAEAAWERRFNTVDIPMADLLPTFGRAWAILKALRVDGQ